MYSMQEASDSEITMLTKAIASALTQREQVTRERDIELLRTLPDDIAHRHAWEEAIEAGIEALRREAGG